VRVNHKWEKSPYRNMACLGGYLIVQNFFSSSLLPKNIKFKVYRTIILPVFYMGVKLGLSYEGTSDMYAGRNAGCWWGNLRERDYM